MGENIVEQICKELGLTHQQLADMMGTSKSSVDRWASSKGEIPEQCRRMIEILLENQTLKTELSEIKTAIGILTKHAK